MRNEKNVIRLTHSSLQAGVTHYHFHIECNQKIYRFSCRYSKLRSVIKMFPKVLRVVTKTERKFPQPCHLGMFISNLLGSKELLESRYEEMSKYFDEISGHPQLFQNEGFRMIVEESEFVREIQENGQDSCPKTPQVGGRRLCKREIKGQLLIVIN